MGIKNLLICRLVPKAVKKITIETKGCKRNQITMLEILECKYKLETICPLKINGSKT